MPVDDIQFLGHPGDQGALQGDGQQDHAEDDVENVVLQLGIEDRRHDGEHDGGGAAQAHEGDERLLLEWVFPEGRQNGEYCSGTRNQQQEDKDGQRRHDGLGEQARPGEQAQHEEDEYLHQAGHAVEETDQGLLVLEFFVPQNDTGDIDAQVAVSADQARKGVGGDGGT